MNNIKIRKYQDNDWKSIEEIHDAARKIELSVSNLEKAFVPLKQAAVDEDLFDYNLFVATEDDKVVAFVAHTDTELAWLYVHPKHMRKGIATVLVKYVEDNTVKRPLELEVLIDNKPAIKFYESLGFIIADTLSGKMPGNESFLVTVHVMKKN